MPRLRAVEPDEVPKPKRKKSMTEAAETGDDLALFEALRRRLVEALNDPRTPAHAMAPLARQVGQTTETIDRMVQRHKAEADATTAPADEPWDADAI